MAQNPEFVKRGAEFMKTHPDFNERLQAAHIKGLDMNPAAPDEIERLAMPELVYWLTDDSRGDDANNLKNLENRPDESREYVRQLAARIERQGYGRDLGTDTYLTVRRQAKTAGLTTDEMLALRGNNDAVSQTDAYILARKLERRRR